jgi:radical SAM protein with 4Fe4S-binding SPASM domain
MTAVVRRQARARIPVTALVEGSDLAITTDATVAGLGGLRYVEVETSRFCNRTCRWCPNGHSDARRVQELMPWPLFASVVDELGASGYAGWFAFHNFNEPLANERLGEEIAYVREVAPGAKPAVYTNGDLLRPGRLDDLLAAGVAYVRVTRYPRDPATVPTAEGLDRWLARSGLAAGRTWRHVPLRQGPAVRLENVAAQVGVLAPHIGRYNDRGGTASRFGPMAARTEPCGLTATSLSVDYQGDVKMCCNVVPDIAEHHRYVVGNLADATLTELWSSPAMQDWRVRHAAADWSASPACRSCVQALPETRR